MTLTRCSSTPGADILVNSVGSTRSTHAAKGVSPPQCSTSTRMPGSTSGGVPRREVGDDLDVAGVTDLEEPLPGRHHPLASRNRFSMTPSTAASTSGPDRSGRPCGSASAGRGPIELRGGNGRGPSGVDALFGADDEVPPRLERLLVVCPASNSSCSCFSSDVARSRAAGARCSSARARASAVWATSTAAAAATRPRASTIGAAPGAAGRPPSCHPRLRCPAPVDQFHGAGHGRRDDEPMVDPGLALPSMVTASAPRVTVPTSTAVGSGHNATTRRTPITAAACRTRRLVSRRTCIWKNYSRDFGAATRMCRSAGEGRDGWWGERVPGGGTRACSRAGGGAGSGCRLPITGSRLPVPGCRLPVAGCRSPVADSPTPPQLRCR